MRQRPSDSAAPSECLPPPPPSTKPWEGVSSEFQVILKEVPFRWARRCLSKHLSLHQLCWGKVGLRDWFRETGTGTSAPWGPSVSVSAARIANDHQGRCLRSRCFSRRIHTRTGRGSGARGWPPALPSPRCPAHLISSRGPGMARCSTS